MLQITDKATSVLDDHFAGKDKEILRIYLAPGGCSGPRLSLALDSQKDDDEMLEAGGYRFVVEKELLKAAAPLSIDAGCCGFDISSSLQLGGGCGSGCGGSCS